MAKSYVTQMDEAADWRLIDLGLRSLLGLNVDVQGTRRLDYGTMEKIFYTLLNSIDHSIRWDCYPARNSAEESRFIDIVVNQINSRKLCGTMKVTPTHVKMLGGLPFRRILTNLLKTAISSETMRLSHNCKFQEYSGNIDELRSAVRMTMAEIESEMKKLAEQDEENRKNELYLRDKWNELESELNIGPYSESTIGSVRTALMVKLEKIHGRQTKSIEDMKLPEQPKGFRRRSSMRPLKIQYILNKSTAEIERGKKLKQVIEGLDAYDKQIATFKKLIEKLQDEADAELLKRPGMQELYDELVVLFPYIEVVEVL